MTGLTMTHLLGAIGRARGLAPMGSLRIVYAPHALAETTERLFPESRHRSARIRKKLIKRHGGEFRKKPCMWRVHDTIYAHPSFKAQLEATIPSGPVDNGGNSLPSRGSRLNGRIFANEVPIA